MLYRQTYCCKKTEYRKLQGSERPPSAKIGIFTLICKEGRVLRWTLSDNLPRPGTVKEISYECTVTVYPVAFDFPQVTEIYPYDTLSQMFIPYTGGSGVYVDPGNARIEHLADSIQAVSSDIIDYARRCYEMEIQLQSARRISGKYRQIVSFTGNTTDIAFSVDQLATSAIIANVTGGHRSWSGLSVTTR